MTSESVVQPYTYAENGDYFITITAYDIYDNYVVETTSASIDDNDYDWRIPLNTGWNLISFPMIPTDEDGNVDTSIGNVILDRIYDSLPDSGYVIMQYDAITGEWDKSRRSSYGPLNNIIPGYAYWIEVTQDTVLKGYGVETDGQGMPPSVELGSSWNLIGKFGDNPVEKSLSVNNLVFGEGFGNLGAFPMMYDGDFVEAVGNLIHY